MSLNGFRSRVRSFFLGEKDDKPVIMTEYGPVTESARLQAAINMKADPEKKKQVEGILAKQYGSLAKGLIEARRRYPEAYDD